MSTSGISPTGILALILVWLVGAAHLQMHLTQTAVFYSSRTAPGGWEVVCRYYLPVKLLEVYQPVTKPCATRRQFTKAGKPV